MYKESLTTEVNPKQGKKPANNFQPVLLYSKFRTKDHCYIYDTHSNEILQVSQVAYDIINEYLKNSNKNIKKELAAKFNYPEAEIQEAIDDIEEGKRNGYLKLTDIRKMNFYENNEILLNEVKHKIRSLGLEVTTRCNFRCKYCAFSGHYPGKRHHGARDMDWYTARNAIDVLMRYSDSVEGKKNIAFWGGEPMLNFPLIRKVVQYMKDNYPDEDMLYNFTTNGSLFTDENIEFLIKHKFSMQISLNGPQHIHDKYRVDINGKGTFDRVMQGLQKIRDKDKDYYELHIGFMCTLTPNTDYREVLSFFSGNELFDKVTLSISNVNPYETTFFEEYGNYSMEDKKYIKELYYDAAVNEKIENERFLGEFYQTCMLNMVRRCRHNQGERIAPNGCCIPLVKRIHVDVNGDIHLCERMPGYNPFGNVNGKGIDFDRLIESVDAYTTNSLSNCRSCWAVRFCQTCFKDFLRHNKWYGDNRKEICKDMRGIVLSELAFYSAIIEKNPRAFDYMQKIKVTN